MEIDQRWKDGWKTPAFRMSGQKCRRLRTKKNFPVCRSHGMREISCAESESTQRRRRLIRLQENFESKIIFHSKNGDKCWHFFFCHVSIFWANGPWEWADAEVKRRAEANWACGLEKDVVPDGAKERAGGLVVKIKKLSFRFYIIQLGKFDFVFRKL